MKMPRFTNSLHFRMSALFLILLGISIGGYYMWINATVFKAYDSKEEEIWFEEKEEPEMADLALKVGTLMDQGEGRDKLLAKYGRTIKNFGAEITLFDTLGVNITAARRDSSSHAAGHVDPALLLAMTGPDWDYSSYPLNTTIDAYENRIIDVKPVHRDGEADGPVLAYLAASFDPVTVGVDEITSDWSSFGFRALVLMLAYTILTALIIMAWTSRRLRKLTLGVASFSAGHFDHRIEARSADEIGSLGRHFNTMASHIQTMMDELAAKEQFQRQLIANVSHDLRTPLASLKGYIETLGRDLSGKSPRERERYLGIIANNLDHLDKLIERTLILSRLESGQAHLRREEFALGELADAVLLRCASLAETRGVAMNLEMDPDPGDYLVKADALQISLVLQNLVENGIKFNKQGGHLTIRLIPHPNTIEAQVSDDGCGIPAEDLPHIFDRFFIGEKSRTRSSTTGQATGSQPEPASTGLGLAIAGKIINSHGSELKVTSEAGRGTCFSFHLARTTGIADHHSHQATD